MESAHSERVRYNIVSKVTKVFKEGPQWFVHFYGSWEALAVGLEEPDLKPGDFVHITFMKVEADALPSQTPIQ